VRKQVLLFDVATTATVVIGVLTLYAVLFLLAVAGALLLVVGPLFAEDRGTRCTCRTTWSWPG
jgi:hypothetical protein